jgi:hypothetical protein
LNFLNQEAHIDTAVGRKTRRDVSWQQNNNKEYKKMKTKLTNQLLQQSRFQVSGFMALQLGDMRLT